MSVVTSLGTVSISVELDKDESKELLDYFASKGYKELDSALRYGDGKTEQMLGELDAANSFVISTKANPWYPTPPPSKPGTVQISRGLSKENIQSQLETSLSSLKAKDVDIFYLHAPDENTPLEETLAAVTAMYKQNRFKRFGLSNFPTWKIAEIVCLCRANDWIVPTVYQGMYNFITREVERDLFPCLRHFGISFYAYSPLAGGILSGKYKFTDNPNSGRLSASTYGGLYRNRFWNETLFKGLENLQIVCEPHGITVLQASLRWLYHHSKLSGAHKDAVVLGASSLAQLRDNLEAAEQGSLPNDVVETIEQIAVSLQAPVLQYFK